MDKIKVLVIGDKQYNFKDLLEANPRLEIVQAVKNLTPKWIQSDVGDFIIDPTWLNFNIATYGYDIVAFVTPNYKREDTMGYSLRSKSLGSFQCIVADTNKPREKGKGWRRSNQVAGSLEHEIQHALYRGCNLLDRTHEFDKGDGFPEIDLSRFQGWEIPGTVRLFKRKTRGNGDTYEILYKEVKVSLYSLYPWLWKRFGYVEEI